MRHVSCPGALLVGLMAIACGGDKKEDQNGTAGKSVADAPARPAVTVDAAPLALGVTRPSDFAYEWGKGAKAFAPAAAAHKKQDWVAVRQACEEAVAADPTHLDAHRLLASALAQQGEYEKAIDHLKVALAGDWVRWGSGVEADPDLEPLISSPLGAALKQMVAATRDEFARSARAGLLLVARRAPFKEPAPSKKPGTTARLASRAEVFAYIKETQRYLRLTQTGFQVLGLLPSPSGDEIAYVAATNVALPDAAPAAPASPAPSAAPPVLAVVQVGTVSVASPDTRSPVTTIKNARALALEYLAGDELVATSYDPLGQWGLGPAHAFSIDRASGKARPARPPAEATGEVPAGRRLLVRYEDVELEAPGDADGIAADWNPETGAAEEFVIDSSKKRIQLPAGEGALRSSLAWSPDRARLAFATAADPCAALPMDRQSALYLVEAESGKLKHVFKGATRFHARFLDAVILAFEDDEGGARLYDAAVAREVGRLDNRTGLAFFGLGAVSAVPCKSEPAAGAPAPPASPPGSTTAPPEGE